MGDFTINGAHNLHVETLLEFPKQTPFMRMNGGTITKVSSGYGSFLFQEFKTSQYDIWLSEYRLLENATLVGTIDHPILELQFMLDQEVDYSMKGLGTARMPGWSFNLNYSPYVENKVFMRKGARVVTFDVHLPQETLQEIVAYCPALDSFLELASQCRFASYSSRANKITAEMLDNIYTTLRSPFTAEMQYNYIESKIHTLVLLALAYPAGNLAPSIKPTAYETECLEDIRDYLLTNLDRPISIIGLARKYGINDCKLKKLFKDKYGITILGMVIKERMDKACMYLKSTRLPITEIAYTIGYKTPNSFIDMFRAHFGMSPGDYRKAAN